MNTRPTQIAFAIARAFGPSPANLIFGAYPRDVFEAMAMGEQPPKRFVYVNSTEVAKP